MVFASASGYRRAAHPVQAHSPATSNARTWRPRIACCQVVDDDLVGINTSRASGDEILERRVRNPERPSHWALWSSWSISRLERTAGPRIVRCSTPSLASRAAALGRFRQNWKTGSPVSRRSRQPTKGSLAWVRIEPGPVGLSLADLPRDTLKSNKREPGRQSHFLRVSTTTDSWPGDASRSTWSSTVSVADDTDRRQAVVLFHSRATEGAAFRRPRGGSGLPRLQCQRATTSGGTATKRRRVDQAVPLGSRAVEATDVEEFGSGHLPGLSDDGMQPPLSPMLFAGMARAVSACISWIRVRPDRSSRVSRVGLYLRNFHRCRRAGLSR